MSKLVADTVTVPCSSTLMAGVAETTEAAPKTVEKSVPSIKSREEEPRATESSLEAFMLAPLSFPAASLTCRIPPYPSLRAHCQQRAQGESGTGTCVADTTGPG